MVADEDAWSVYAFEILQACDLKSATTLLQSLDCLGAVIMPGDGIVIAASDPAAGTPDDQNGPAVKQERGEEAGQPANFAFWGMIFGAFVKSFDVDHEYLLVFVRIRIDARLYHGT